jgi:hypothetical protein
MLANLRSGMVARIELEGGETARGVKSSITRAARRLGKDVDVWDAAGSVFAQMRD